MIADGRFSLLKTTLLDYPGKVAAAVFLPGCNLRCPYCHNPELVDPKLISRAASLAAGEGPLNCDLPRFEAFLEKRARILGGVVFSGGEALLHPLLPKLFRLAKQKGLPVKIDSAGLLPDLLAEYLSEGLIDYAAVDLKTAPNRYGELGWKGSVSAESLLSGTLDLLNESGTDFEVRTTHVPSLVEEEDLLSLVPLASRAPRWIWQTYMPGETLNPQWKNIKAKTEDELKSLSCDYNGTATIIIR